MVEHERYIRYELEISVTSKISTECLQRFINKVTYPQQIVFKHIKVDFCDELPLFINNLYTILKDREFNLKCVDLKSTELVTDISRYEGFKLNYIGDLMLKSLKDLKYVDKILTLRIPKYSHHLISEINNEVEEVEIYGA